MHASGWADTIRDIAAVPAARAGSERHGGGGGAEVRAAARPAACAADLPPGIGAGRRLPAGNAGNGSAAARRKDGHSQMNIAIRRAPGVSPKGQQTRAAIVDTALQLAMQIGLEGLSIGGVAEASGMSKSGVFAHFGSREELQLSVIRAYHERFEQEVFFPAIRQPRGLPRLAALYENWMHRVADEAGAGCIYISGAVEFDHRPGQVRDALRAMVQVWLVAMEKAIRQTQMVGDLDAALDPHQLLFEIHGFILALHYEARFLQVPQAVAHARAAFERLLAVSRPRRP